MQLYCNILCAQSTNPVLHYWKWILSTSGVMFWSENGAGSVHGSMMAFWALIADCFKMSNIESLLDISVFVVREGIEQRGLCFLHALTVRANCCSMAPGGSQHAKRWSNTWWQQGTGSAGLGASARASPVLSTRTWAFLKEKKKLSFSLHKRSWSKDVLFCDSAEWHPSNVLFSLSPSSAAWLPSSSVALPVLVKLGATSQVVLSSDSSEQPQCCKFSLWTVSLSPCAFSILRT